MFTAGDIVLGVLLPAAIALGVAMIAWLPRRREHGAKDRPSTSRGASTTDAVLDYAEAPLRPSRAAWAGGVGIGVGFAVAFCFITGGAVPKFPPAETTDRLFYIALVLAVFGAGEAFMPASRLVRAIPVFIVAASVMAALLRFKTQGDWTAVESILIIAGIGVLAIAWWASLEDVARLDGGLSVGLVMVLVGGAVSAVMMLANSLTFGKLGGALTAAVGGATVIWFWRRTATLARGGVTAFAALTLCLIVGAYYLFDLKPLYAALLAAAPLLAWSGHLLPRRVAPWKRTLVRLIAMLIPLGVTLALAARDFQRASGADESSDPYSSIYSS